MILGSLHRGIYREVHVGQREVGQAASFCRVPAAAHKCSFELVAIARFGLRQAASRQSSTKVESQQDEGHWVILVNALAAAATSRRP